MMTGPFNANRSRRISRVEEEIEELDKLLEVVRNDRDDLDLKMRRFGQWPKTLVVLTFAIAVLFGSAMLWVWSLEALVPTDQVTESSILHRMSLYLNVQDRETEWKTVNVLGGLLFLTWPALFMVQSIGVAYRPWAAFAAAFSGLGLLLAKGRTEAIPVDRFSFIEGLAITLPFCALAFLLSRRGDIYTLPSTGLSINNWAYGLLILPLGILFLLGFETGLFFPMLGVLASCVSMVLFNLATVHIDTLLASQKLDQRYEELEEERAAKQRAADWLRSF